MMTLIERLERMGRRGAQPALLLTAGLVVFAVASAVVPWVYELGRWPTRGMHLAGFLSAGFAMVFGILGARLLTAREYPPPEQVFPSLDPEDFRRAMYEEPRPFCACARCRIHIPAQFSTGACPRCESTIEYYEVESDEDAQMVLAAMQQ